MTLIVGAEVAVAQRMSKHVLSPWLDGWDLLFLLSDVSHVMGSAPEGTLPSRTHVLELEDADVAIRQDREGLVAVGLRATAELVTYLAHATVPEARAVAAPSQVEVLTRQGVGVQERLRVLRVDVLCVLLQEHIRVGLALLVAEVVALLDDLLKRATPELQTGGLIETSGLEFVVLDDHDPTEPHRIEVALDERGELFSVHCSLISSVDGKGC